MLVLPIHWAIALSIKILAILETGKGVAPKIPLVFSFAK
jgi:hypothetical protein